MTIFLALSSTYHQVEISLWSDNTLSAMETIDKKIASRDLTAVISKLLAANRVRLIDLSFIAVNQGPAPFTTLRTVIATANGLSFASGIPLVGIDGFHALSAACQDPQWPFTIYLLNAFGNDLYFFIEHPDRDPETGYANASALLARISSEFPDVAIRFIGNGAHLYQSAIETIFGSRAYLPHETHESAPMQQIGKLGYAAWLEKKGLANQILPLYLKKHPCELLLEGRTR